MSLKFTAKTVWTNGDTQTDQFKINSTVMCIVFLLIFPLKWGNVLMCSFLLIKGQTWTWGLLCSLSPKPVKAMLASQHSKTPRLTDVELKCENEVIDDGSHAAVYQKEKFSWMKKKIPLQRFWCTWYVLGKNMESYSLRIHTDFASLKK